MFYARSARREFSTNPAGNILSGLSDRCQRVPALRVIDETPLRTRARVFVLGLAAERDDLDVALPRLGAACFLISLSPTRRS